MLTKMPVWIRPDDNNHGFTLVELVVVMAILAILAAIVVPRYTNVLNNANTKADAANIKMLQDAVDLYAVENPTADVKNWNIDTMKTNLENKYVKEIPFQPDSSTKKYVTDQNGLVKKET